MLTWGNIDVYWSERQHAWIFVDVAARSVQVIQSWAEVTLDHAKVKNPGIVSEEFNAADCGLNQTTLAKTENRWVISSKKYQHLKIIYGNALTIMSEGNNGGAIESAAPPIECPKHLVGA